MKKILVLLLAVLTVLSLCACGAAGKKEEKELTAEEKYAAAEKMVGSPYADLEKAIGPAESSVHSARCGTAGEDYEYTYPGFYVLTYKEGDSEVIEEVEKAE